MARERHAQPKLHASAIGRILHAPQGYAPGNIPQDTHIVGAPAPEIETLAQQMRQDLGKHGSLLDRVQGLTRLRRGAQYAVMALAVAVGGMAILSGKWSPTDLSLEAIARSAVGFVLEATRAARWWVLALLLGMGLAYLVNLVVSRKMRCVFSTFWFRVRSQSTAASSGRSEPPEAPADAAE